MAAFVLPPSWKIIILTMMQTKNRSHCPPLLFPFIFLPLLLGPLFSQGQAFNRLVFDRTQSQFFAAENIQTIHKFVYQGMDRILPPKLWEEEKRGRKVLGMGYRLGKTFLLDFTVDHLAILINHEIFGHGSRYREFGAEESVYHLELAPPWGPGSGFARMGGLPEGRYLSQTERSLITISGNEANTVLADEMERRILPRGRLHYREGALMILSAGNLPWYIWVDDWNTRLGYGGGDPSTYIFQMNSLYGSVDRLYTLDRLKWHSLVTYLNPMQFYSAWALLVSYGLRGDAQMSELPTLKIKKNRLLPSMSYNFTPFGAEFILRNYVLRPIENSRHPLIANRLFGLRLSYGDPFFNNFYAGSLVLQNAYAGKYVQVGGEVGMWDQPGFEYGDTTGLIAVPGGLGGYAKVDLTLTPLREHPELGFFLQGGYKAHGYLMGEALQAGPILRFGLAAYLD